MAKEPDFKYAPMFQLGKDTTEYRLLSKEGVSVGEFEGKRILKVSKEALTLLAQQAFHDCEFMLRRAHNEQVAKILTDPEASENDTGLGRWNDLSGLLLPATEEHRLIEDIKDGTLDTIHDVIERFEQIHRNYRVYQWTWTYRLILDYYGIKEISEQDDRRIKNDYVEARRAWVAEIKKDAEKEYAMGDVEREVYEQFVNQLDHEVDYEGNGAL